MGMYDTNGIEIRRSMNDNLTEVRLGQRITLWFSYTTPVAFAVSGEGTFKTDRRYSQTTGRHLATIAGRTIPMDEFEERLNRLLASINLATELTPIGSLEVSEV